MARKKKTPEARHAAEAERRRKAKIRIRHEMNLRVPQKKGSVEDRVAAYLAMNERDRTQYHPQDAEQHFWDLYDRGVGV